MIDEIGFRQQVLRRNSINAGDISVYCIFFDNIILSHQGEMFFRSPQMAHSRKRKLMNQWFVHTNRSGASRVFNETVPLMDLAEFIEIRDYFSDNILVRVLNDHELTRINGVINGDPTRAI